MFTIKEASVEDCKILEDIEKQCFSDPWSYGMLESEVGQSNTTYSLFYLDDQVIGYYSYLHIFNEAHIMNIAILPSFQGFGYGSAMMETLLEQSLLQGLDNLTLEVRRSNVKAIGLYEKYLFKCVGIRPHYYMDGEDALIYWLYRD